jgi:hypothetical protein
LKCTICDFTSTSQQGLKVHAKRKHTESNFSKTCDLCNKTFKSYDKFRNHKFDHTNWDRKTNKYSCKECDFIGNNMFTHEVHMGKVHTKNYECGLCDVGLKNLENLEIHQSTCEMYRCRSCGKKEKTISDIKKHTQLFHGPSSIIDHLKLCRNDQQEVNEQMYWDFELKN